MELTERQKQVRELMADMHCPFPDGRGEECEVLGVTDYCKHCPAALEWADGVLRGLHAIGVRLSTIIGDGDPTEGLDYTEPLVPKGAD